MKWTGNLSFCFLLYKMGDMLPPLQGHLEGAVGLCLCVIVLDFWLYP